MELEDGLGGILEDGCGWGLLGNFGDVSNWILVTRDGFLDDAYFQLTQAATTPKGSHLTSLCLYINKKFVGRLSGCSAFSPC